jgi:hypothetical protein
MGNIREDPLPVSVSARLRRKNAIAHATKRNNLEIILISGIYFSQSKTLNFRYNE